jgi:hypothetical protein
LIGIATGFQGLAWRAFDLQLCGLEIQSAIPKDFKRRNEINFSLRELEYRPTEGELDEPFTPRVH